MKSGNLDELFRSDALKAYRYRSYGTPDSRSVWEQPAILLAATLATLAAIGTLQILTVPRPYRWLATSSVAIGNGNSLQIWLQTPSPCPSHLRLHDRTVPLASCRILSDGSQIWTLEDAADPAAIARHNPMRIDGYSGRESLWHAMLVAGRGT